MPNSSLTVLLVDLLGRLVPPLHLSPQQAAALEAHFQLFTEWGAVHNLSRVMDLKEAAERHYFDCICGIHFLSAQATVMDVGTGAGFPGLVAALLWPDSRITLVESDRKKCSFLRTAIKKMQLRNVELLNMRLEDTQQKANLILTRAAVPVSQVPCLLSHLKQNGKLALWLKDVSKFDLEQMLPNLDVDGVFSYVVDDKHNHAIAIISQNPAQVSRGTRAVF